MLNNILYFLQLLGVCIGSVVAVAIFGCLLCDFTNKFRWIPIALYFIIMWGSIIAACFVEPQLVLRAVL